MTKFNPLNVMVISSQLLYLEALQNLLNSKSILTCKGLLTTNPNIKSILKKESPKLLLIDANSLEQRFWDFVQDTHTNNPEIKTIILANSNEPIYIDLAKRHGTSGYILKSSPLEILMASIKIIKNGGQFFDYGDYNQPEQQTKVSFGEVYKLSKREMEVIVLIKNANTTRDIAKELDLSFHTIEAHRKNIYKKLKVKKVTELIKLISEFEN
ncbi:response regulator transcription factor [Arcticibacterium luteifluviistationis]|uniref:HTH luxR-type domain-containing protein n=1 Tax=Arcticibacterium luteifluviistationis TaxID=1784714 RepID=A0A2Z4G9Y8_9BACT|nr:response regulator transcription factor [Arcticibacterium luteifluviistationis]AWV98031.1 hypothetical protein DJ013_07545 [Arcticibacterium luteifluviistationis]